MDDDVPAISGLLDPITINQPDVLQATFSKWMHHQSQSTQLCEVFRKSIQDVGRDMTIR